MFYYLLPFLDPNLAILMDTMLSIAGWNLLIAYGIKRKIHHTLAAWVLMALPLLTAYDAAQKILYFKSNQDILNEVLCYGVELLSLSIYYFATKWIETPSQD